MRLSGALLSNSTSCGQIRDALGVLETIFNAVCMCVTTSADDFHVTCMQAIIKNLRNLMKLCPPLQGIPVASPNFTLVVSWVENGRNIHSRRPNLFFVLWRQVAVHKFKALFFDFDHV